MAVNGYGLSSQRGEAQVSELCQSQTSPLWVAPHRIPQAPMIVDGDRKGAAPLGQAEIGLAIAIDIDPLAAFWIRGGIVSSGCLCTRRKEGWKEKMTRSHGPIIVE